MKARLFLVTDNDEAETPMYCSEDCNEVAAFLGCDIRSLRSKMSRARKSNKECRYFGKKIHEVFISDQEFKEVTKDGKP